MKNEQILNALYNPDDRLGVQLFGPEKWNLAKGAACGVTNAVISRRYVPKAYSKEYAPLFNALFRPDRAKFQALLGASAPIDYIPYDWARSVSDIGHGVTEGLKNIPFFTPWISAGRSVNSAMASFLNMLGLKSSKADADDTPTVKKTAVGLGSVLLIGAAGYGIYYLAKGKKKRRH